MKRAAAASAPGGAVVTGAGRGLGRGIALMLAARGHAVHVTDLDGGAAAAVAAEIEAAGHRGAFASALDVRDARACEAAAEHTVERTGSVTAWVNNAGVLTTGRTWEADEDERRLMLEVNALGTMNGTLAALTPMRAAGRGHIVNIASLAGIVAVPGEGVYAASKHAVMGFTLSTAADLRLAGERNVRISAVCPDGIWTPMLHSRVDDPAAAHSFGARLLQPDEVVRAVSRLLDRPRAVVTVPRGRGAFVRVVDAFPDLAIAVAPLVTRRAERRQSRYAARLGGR